MKYFGNGSDKIEKVTHDHKNNQLHINPNSYFDNVSDAAWNYHIGGYQVLRKYLDDRRKPRKELDNPRTFSRIITAITKTIELQKEIDGIYEGVEERLME